LDENHVARIDIARRKAILRDTPSSTLYLPKHPKHKTEIKPTRFKDAQIP